MRTLNWDVHSFAEVITVLRHILLQDELFEMPFWEIGMTQVPRMWLQVFSGSRNCGHVDKDVTNQACRTAVICSIVYFACQDFKDDIMFDACHNRLW